MRLKRFLTRREEQTIYNVDVLAIPNELIGPGVFKMDSKSVRQIGAPCFFRWDRQRRNYRSEFLQTKMVNIFLPKTQIPKSTSMCLSWRSVLSTSRIIAIFLIEISPHIFVQYSKVGMICDA